MKRIEAKIADPELGDLKTLIRYGTYDQKTPFIIKSSRSRLYRIITKKKASKENILCLVDDKSVKINSLYKNEIHK